MTTALKSLGAVLREQGGLMASLVADDAPAPTPGQESGGSLPARLAASGPRTSAAAADYELLIEMIFEGYLLHYGVPRLVRPADIDLGLLAGDQLYALGLARLVALGDLAAVAELADVITISALAQASGQAELALAVWAAGARAVGWGTSPEHERAKALARAGSPEALGAMQAVAAL
jgi:hypothetical protein